MIAVDMDGTFLDDQKKYNKERFLEQFKKMNDQNIHFVIASGNRLDTLQRYFEDLASNLSYIAENGALVVDQTEEIKASIMDKKTAKECMSLFEDYPDLRVIVCGKHNVYIREEDIQKNLDKDSEFENDISRYFVAHEIVPNFDAIDDDIFKFAIKTPTGKSDYYYSILNEILPDSIRPTSTGFDFIDVIQSDQHKGNGIEILQNYWGITSDETAAFGDNGNDIEMLEHVTYSFAMENAIDEAKEAAKYIIGHNNNEAVLDTIDRILDGTI